MEVRRGGEGFEGRGGDRKREKFPTLFEILFVEKERDCLAYH